MLRLTKNEDIILRVLAQKNASNIEELIKRTNLTKEVIELNVNSLIQKGMIVGFKKEV